MAIQPLQPTETPELPNYKQLTWLNLANGDTGVPADYPHFDLKTVQVFGTWGTGGSVTLQGSNDPRAITNPGSAVWSTLTDSQGNVLTLTADGMKRISQNPRYIRPSVTAGDGITLLNCIIACRQSGR